MCEPMTIASIALTGASAVANSMANSKVASARSRSLAAERQRQQALDAEAAAHNSRSQESYQGFEGQQEQKAKSLGDYFTNPAAMSGVQPAGTPTETMPDASGIVVAENAKQLGRAKAYTDQQGRALGNLRSFGDLMGGLARDQARDAGYIGQLGGFKQGSAGILPVELDAAGHAGDGLKMIGDIARGLGSIGTSAGLSRNVAPAIGGAAGPKAPSMAMPNPYSVWH